MANRFWVGGTASWDATAGTKWATTSGGAGGAAVPTAADDVIFDINSTGLITLNTSGLVCRSFSITTKATGGFTLGTSCVLSIGDASGGALSLNATFVGTGGITWAAAATVNFVSTSTNGGTGWGITTGGQSLGIVTFNGAGGKWVLQDALTLLGACTLTAGTLDTNSKAVTGTTFSSSNANTRSLTLGTSTVLLSGAAAWTTTTTTGMTFSAASSSIVLTSTAPTFAGGNLTYGSVGFFGITATGTVTGAGTFGTLTATGNATKVAVLVITGNITVNTSLGVSGNSAINRLLVSSATVGTAVSVTLGGAATFKTATTTANVDFMDVTVSGGAANERDLSAITGKSGDCQGNTGITFTTSATQTATGTASFTWSTHGWTSRVPLPQDDVVINNAFVAGRTITADMPRIGRSVDFTGASPVIFSYSGITSYGTWTYTSSITASPNATTHVFAGRGAYSVTSGGVANMGATSITAPSGTYTLQDAFTATASGAQTVTNGTFDLNGKTFTTAGTVNISSGATISLNAGTVAYTGTGVPWSCSGTVTNPTGSTISLTAATASSRTFGGNGQTYGTLTYTVANSPGQLIITGANTFGTLNVGSGRELTLPSATTTTVTNWNVQGAVNGYVRLPGVSGSYISAPDSAALSITGPIDLRVRVAPDNWQATAQVLISKYLTSGSQRSYAFDTEVGIPTLYTSGTGAVLRTWACTANVSTIPGYTSTTAYWLRVTLDTATGNANFGYADGALTNPVAADFTALGTQVAGTSGATFDSTALLNVGAYEAGTGFLLAGNFYRAQVRNGIDGTLVFDADLTPSVVARSWLDGACTQFAESSAQAATVTLNGTAVQGDGRVTVDASTGASAATVTTGGGATSAFVTVKDSTVTPSGAVYALDGKSVSNNTGWWFSPPNDRPQMVRSVPQQPVGASRAAQRAGSW